MAQLADQSLPTPEDLGSNLAIGNFDEENWFDVNWCKDENKGEENWNIWFKSLFFFKKNGHFFVKFSSLFRHNLNIIWKKRRYCACHLNPGRRIVGADGSTELVWPLFQVTVTVANTQCFIFQSREYCTVDILFYVLDSAALLILNDDNIFTSLVKS